MMKVGYRYALPVLWCSCLCAQSLQIISPNNGSSFAPGDPINIIVNVQGTFASVAVVGQDIGTSLMVTSPPYAFSLIAPNQTSGAKTLTAVGFTGPGAALFSPPVMVEIESKASLVSLTVNVTTLKFQYLGQQIPLAVTGKFSDGSVADVSKSSKTSYMSGNTAVSSNSADGVAIAVGPGNTSLTIVYGTVSKILPVSVPNSLKGDLDGNGVVDQNDLNVILAAVNTTANKPVDARDLNKDGLINALDARILVTLCTRPGCATH
jgi:hypothetical protein